MMIFLFSVTINVDMPVKTQQRILEQKNTKCEIIV